MSKSEIATIQPEDKSQSADEIYPVLPLRDVVVYPHMVIPLFVGREKSINALEASMNASQKIFLVAQQKASDENPSKNNLFTVGTIATILQLLRLPDGTLKVLVEGNARAGIKHLDDIGTYLQVKVEPMEDIYNETDDIEPLTRSLLSQFDQYVKLNKKIPPEVLSSLTGIDEPTRMVDTIAAHMTMKMEDRQSVLEQRHLKKRMEMLMHLMESEIDILQVEKRIRNRVKRQMEKNQREYYLNEQMKAIQKELGEIGEGYNSTEALEEKIKKAKMPKEALDKTMSELKKLKAMSPMSAEASVCRNYIETMLAVPWSKSSRVKHDIPKAEKILNEDHYGLESVKDRILEYLAVQKRVKKIKGPILCLVGPPGVGKTSLGASIARATGRKFARIALGGVRDEAEIRGHRRTYVGSLPGKIIQKLSKVSVRNPLFLLDEIDKMAMDFRGDPSSALLEVLDPEQNNSFNDHYLEVDYDLSDVMFVATANSLDIPAPLLDRMEVIRLAGYTEDEKRHIAKQYLMPKHLKLCGLKNKELKIDESVITDIVHYYTRESGVRGLEREIAKICRKAVKELALAKNKKTVSVTSKNIEDYLGVKRFRFGSADEADQIGQVTGLAWTEVGGELLKIEAIAVPGKGKTLRTGKLGDVMQESIQAAISVVRSRAKEYGIAEDFYEKVDLHIHVPEGATPKDGPSAGIAMCTALVSVLSKTPVRADVAMTGEITLRGEVLPIGGLKEKLLAAHRGGIKTVIIPHENERDLKEIPSNIIGSLEIKPVQWVDEVLDIALSKATKKAQKGDKSKKAV
jgi:ATP-dependent Lon protease